MSLFKCGTIWTVVVVLTALSLSCTRGPVEPIPQYGDISGYVRGFESQRAIAGATVTLVDQTYQVSRSGIYIFKNIPEGFHTLKAQKAGFHPYRILIKVVDNTVHNVYMDKMTEYRSISGHVRLDGGSIAVPDAVVICGDVYDTTDAEGYYHLKDVTAQTHKLFARKNHYISFEARVMLENDTTIPIHLASAQLTGVVEHRLYGLIEGAKVEVGEAITFTSSNGSYYLPTAPQGTHQIAVSHPDYDSTRQQVTIGADGGRYDVTMTVAICDTIPVEQDASITHSQLEGCSDCPDWGDVDRNHGGAEQLKLEYFLKTEPGPPRKTLVAQTRLLLQLPQLPEGADRLNMSGIHLLLYPAVEHQRTEYVTMRLTASGGTLWEENSVTWADGPRPSSLVYAAELAQQGRSLSFDVMPLLREFGPQGVSVILQKEEIGLADPAQRMAFWSSEAPDPDLRPMIVVKYSY